MVQASREAGCRIDGGMDHKFEREYVVHGEGGMFEGCLIERAETCERWNKRRLLIRCKLIHR